MKHRLCFKAHGLNPYQWRLKAYCETTQTRDIVPTRVFLLSVTGKNGRKWSPLRFNYFRLVGKLKRVKTLWTVFLEKLPWWSLSDRHTLMTLEPCFGFLFGDLGEFYMKCGFVGICGFRRERDLDSMKKCHGPISHPFTASQKCISSIIPQNIRVDLYFRISTFCIWNFNERPCTPGALVGIPNDIEVNSILHSPDLDKSR